jgi:hypothetical protein
MAPAAIPALAKVSLGRCTIRSNWANGSTRWQRRPRRLQIDAIRIAASHACDRAISAPTRGHPQEAILVSFPVLVVPLQPIQSEDSVRTDGERSNGSSLITSGAIPFQ